MKKLSICLLLVVLLVGCSKANEMETDMMDISSRELEEKEIAQDIEEEAEALFAQTGELVGLHDMQEGWIGQELYIQNAYGTLSFSYHGTIMIESQSGARQLDYWNLFSEEERKIIEGASGSRLDYARPICFYQQGPRVYLFFNGNDATGHLSDAYVLLIDVQAVEVLGYIQDAAHNLCDVQLVDDILYMLSTGSMSFHGEYTLNALATDGWGLLGKIHVDSRYTDGYFTPEQLEFRNGMVYVSGEWEGEFWEKEVMSMYGV